MHVYSKVMSNLGSKLYLWDVMAHAKATVGWLQNKLCNIIVFLWIIFFLVFYGLCDRIKDIEVMKKSWALIVMYMD